MGLIKWLNRHAFTSIFLYFVLMMGVAWAANEAINARTAATSIQDADMLAIYDDDAGAGRSITVSNFRGDNLNAIVNAETGVTDPGITMYDDNGTSTGTAFIYGTSVDDTKAIVMSIGVEEETSGNAVYIELDGINKTVDVLKPLTVTGSIDAGTEVVAFNSALDLGSATYNDRCSGLFWMTGASNADVVVTLPDSAFCSTTVTKELDFYNNETGDYDMIITPASGDKIQIAGTGEDCTADGPLYCNEQAFVTLRALTAGVWIATSMTTSTDCDCTSP